jgi:hypothetical protein
MERSSTKFTLSLLFATLVAMTMFAVEAKGQSDSDGQPELSTSLEPLRPGVAEGRLFDELDAHNQLRKTALLDYTVLRTYRVVDLKGKVHAEEVGQMEFRAPDQKSFVVKSEEGSGVVRRMALNPLISSEIETAAGKQHHDSAISPANYSLNLLGEQRVGPYHCELNLRPSLDADISAADSRVRILVIRAEEDWAIATECWKLARVGAKRQRKVSGQQVLSPAPLSLAKLSSKVADTA